MLPLTLVDLILTQPRVAQHLTRIRPTPLVKSFARTRHALAVQTDRVLHPGPPTSYNATSQMPETYESRSKDAISLQIDGGRFPSHPTALVRSLVNELVELPVSESGSLDGPIYTEEELQNIYTDLLANPNTNQGEPLAISEPLSKDAIQKTLERVAGRLQLLDSSTEHVSRIEANFAQRLKALQRTGDTEVEDPLSPPEPTAFDGEDNAASKASLREKIMSRMIEVVEGVMDAKKEIRSRQIPVLLLSLTEWEALVRSSVSSGDKHGAEKALSLMQNLNVEIPDSLSDCLLNSYAIAGDVDAISSYISRFSSTGPSESQRDRLVKAHLNSQCENYNIGSALQLVHDLESRGQNAPMKAYARVIRHLLNQNTTDCRAQAWDLYAHMRYVAHPQPDEFIYATMIHACALGPSKSSVWTQPEKALDLWKELRTYLGEATLPHVYTYNAIIAVCARSKKFAGEAFRIAREMLDSHRDAFGRPLLKPNRSTFAGLLVAARTRRDLSRARWILAEMLNSSTQTKDIEDSSYSPVVNTGIMTLVFNTYTSFRPPFTRESTRVYDEKDLQPSETEGEKEETVEVIAEEVKDSFSSTAPQTPGEIVTEAKLILNRIVEDRSRYMQAWSEGTSPSPRYFGQVVLSTKLLNAYMCIHYQHGPIEETWEMFYGSQAKDSLFKQLGVERNLQTYVEALERCAYPRNQHDRKITLELAERLWVDVQPLLVVDDVPKAAFGKEARMVERAWLAMIRVMTKDGNLDRAMEILRLFTSTYHPRLLRLMPSFPQTPPSGQRENPTAQLMAQTRGSVLPVSMVSTRVSLFADRPLVRLTSPTDADASVKTGHIGPTTPLLSFDDVEFLHHQLVCAGRKRRGDIDYLKWVCSAYKGELKRRWQTALLGSHSE